MKPILFFLLLMLLCPVRVWAAEPIEIEAAGSLVWHQKDKSYRAVGDASAKQGNTMVRANELTARYAVVKGKNEIHSLEATGNVRIDQNGNTGSAPFASYNTVSGDVRMTGPGAELISAKGDKLTAEQEIRFNDKTGEAEAVGRPALVRDARAIRSNQIQGKFVKDAAGNWALSTATAVGGVVVTSADSIATGDRGTYNALKQTAELNGNVKISRGKNVLTGECAEINTATGEARLLPAANSGAPKQRVRAILYQGK